MPPARTTLAALLPLLLLVAACSGGSKRLQGSWHGLRSEGVAPAAVAAANTFAAALRLDVSGDGITVTTSKDKQVGHYKVVKEDKTSVVIVTDKDGPKDAQTFTFVDDKTMRWAVVDGASIVLQRQ